jgi:8-oxo-dGTP diphosphatase
MTGACLERGESWRAGALREVEEEIQCTVSVEKFAGCCCYEVSGVPKVVLFWNMALVQEGDFLPNKEIDQLAWLSFDQAIERLDYECERRLLRATELESK